MFTYDLEKPVAPVKIPGVTPAPNSKIRMVGSDVNLKWHQDGSDLVIETLPQTLPCDYAWGYQIKLTPVQ